MYFNDIRMMDLLSECEKVQQNKACIVVGNFSAVTHWDETTQVASNIRKQGCNNILEVITDDHLNTAVVGMAMASQQHSPGLNTTSHLWDELSCRYSGTIQSRWQTVFWKGGSFSHM